MDTPIISPEEREIRVTALFAAVGLAPPAAAELAAARWPMTADDVPGECAGRGRSLDREDLADFLRTKFDQGVDPAEIGWPRYLVNEALAWAEAAGRGTPAPPLRSAPGEPVTVDALLGALVHPDLVERVAAALLLARSLGAGLALIGEHAEDVEHIIGPRLSALLGRAAAGERAAAEELARRVNAHANA